MVCCDRVGVNERSGQSMKLLNTKALQGGAVPGKKRGRQGCVGGASLVRNTSPHIARFLFAIAISPRYGLEESVTGVYTRDTNTWAGGKINIAIYQTGPAKCLR